MAEKEQSFQHFLAGKEIRIKERVQWFAFIIAITGLAAAATLAVLGKETTAVIIGGTSLVALVGAFMGNKIGRQKDLVIEKKEKSDQ